jgi:hypothetical protein
MIAASMVVTAALPVVARCGAHRRVTRRPVRELARVTNSGARQRHIVRPDVREIAGNAAEVALGFRGEDGVQALIELCLRQSAVGEVLAQLGGHRLALSVPDAQARLSCHLPSVARRR